MRRLTWAVVLVLQALLMAVAPLSPAASLGWPPVAGADGLLVARIYVQGRDHLNAVAGELDIWETHPQDGYVVAAVTPAQQRWLEDLGYRVVLEAKAAGPSGVAAGLDPRFHYFDDQHPNPDGRHVVDLLQQVNAAHPDLTELIDIGDAWLSGQSGEADRDMWVLRITNEHPAYGAIADKPAFFLAAAMHAREVVSSELAIRYLTYLTEGYGGEGGYGVDPQVTWLVDHHVAYVLVLQNPDGHVENEREIANNRRKTMNWGDGCPYAQYWGVDLNRNHSFLWGCCGGSSADPCSETYRGSSSGSEPETQAFESYFAAVMKDQNGPNGDDEIAPSAPITTTGIFISLHSYGDLVLWPWGFQGHGDAPNNAELRAIGRRFAGFNGYDASGSIWYDVDGAIDDWTYGKFGIPSFTFEVGPSGWGACSGFFPAYECIDGHRGRHFWAENKDALLYAHRIARAPYLRVYGPDVQSVAFTWDNPPEEGMGQVTAALSDRRSFDGAPQAIVGAELFVDLPGADGTGMAMAPLDGAWGGQEESVVATIDASALAPGRRTLLVHGQNHDGRWGPFTVIFLEAGRRTYLPLIVRRPE